MSTAARRAFFRAAAAASRARPPLAEAASRHGADPTIRFLALAPGAPVAAPRALSTAARALALDLAMARAALARACVDVRGRRLANPRDESPPTPSCLQPQRGFTASSLSASGAPLSPEDMKRRVDDINDSFTEAREEIEAAMEAVGTTYFNEEAEYAQEVTERTLAMYYELCDELSEEERGKLQRAMGMKMEQLKAELKQIDHAHDDH